MQLRPSDIVEEELAAAGLSWTVRFGRNIVYTIAGRTYVASRSVNNVRTLKNTRAGIKRLIRDLSNRPAAG